MRQPLEQSLKRHYESLAIPVSSDDLASAASNLVGFFSLLAEVDKKNGSHILREVQLDEEIKDLLS